MTKIDEKKKRSSSKSKKASSQETLSQEEIKKCMKEGVIPKEIGEGFFRQTEHYMAFQEAVKLRLADGSNPSIKEMLNLYHEHYVEKIQIDMEIGVTSKEDFVNFVKKNYKKIVEVLGQESLGTYRVSRDITDRKFPNPQEEQLYLFESKKTHEETDITSTPTTTVEPTIKLPHLDLTEAEDKILMVLCQLLEKHSESYDQNSKGYYMGNDSRGVITIDYMDVETARMAITPHELYRTYLGRDNYGTKDSKYIWENVVSLSNKMFWVLLSIPNLFTKKGGRLTYDVLRKILPLFDLGILNKDQTEKQVAELSDSNIAFEGSGCKLLFKFNPIFTSAIRERYVEYPKDIHLRIARTPSAGKRGRIPQCVNLMRDLLFREKQQKRAHIERDEDTLVRDLGLQKYWKEGRKALVRKKIDQGFAIFIEMGLLLKMEKIIGARGQTKYVMHINLAFE